MPLPKKKRGEKKERKRRRIESKRRRVEKLAEERRRRWLPRLPKDVLEDIFHRLPYRPLAHTKLVCKLWNSIISDQKFIDAHDRCIRSRLSGNHFILSALKRNRDISFYTLNYGADIIDGKTSLSTILPLKNPPELGYKRYNLRLLGSYNGLIAISCYRKLILWNPLTRECKHFEADVYEPDSDFNSFNARVIYGLCYDSGSDEYSLAVGSDYQSPPASPTSSGELEFIDYGSTFAVIHSFKDGKEKWLNNSALSFTLLDHNLFAGETAKVICGVPHWVLQFCDHESPQVQREIIYFDLKDEEFKKMARTPNQGPEKTILGLATMDGERQLGVVLHDNPGCCLEVWVMKEYAVIESWTNLFAIPYQNIPKPLDYLDVLGYMPNGELLLYVNSSALRAYNFEKGTLKDPKLLKGVLFAVAAYEPKLTSPLKRIEQGKHQEDNS